MSFNFILISNLVITTHLWRMMAFSFQSKTEVKNMFNQTQTQTEREDNLNKAWWLVISDADLTLSEIALVSKIDEATVKAMAWIYNMAIQEYGIEWLGCTFGLTWKEIRNHRSVIDLITTINYASEVK